MFWSFADPTHDRAEVAVHIRPDREAVHTQEIDEIVEVSKLFIDSISVDHS